MNKHISTMSTMTTTISIFGVSLLLLLPLQLHNFLVLLFGILGNVNEIWPVFFSAFFFHFDLQLFLSVFICFDFDTIRSNIKFYPNLIMYSMYWILFHKCKKKNETHICGCNAMLICLSLCLPTKPVRYGSDENIKKDRETKSNKEIQKSLEFIRWVIDQVYVVVTLFIHNYN